MYPMVFREYMLEGDRYTDHLALHDLPPASPRTGEWRYHDLWTLDERGLLQHRDELGIQARELIERYHASEDEEIRGGVGLQLLYLNRRREGILRELGRRDRDAVSHALYDHEFPQAAEMFRREQEATRQFFEEFTAQIVARRAQLEARVEEIRQARVITRERENEAYARSMEEARQAYSRSTEEARESRERDREEERRQARIMTNERENEAYTRSMEEARQARLRDRQEERENNPLVRLLPESVRNDLLGGTQEVQDRRRPSEVLISAQVVNGATAQVQIEVIITPSI
jgi:hypothetical protein